ncbi:MAG: ImmA/IrrE family metallo-endopeptidase [Actinomycetales bacterium]|uniref:ImmA/IrrE family metallo-endopeptidase n=1 Tax=Candidatus Phosphoribacter hodrii TaxID=2953743 RepID=A0A9D7T6A0_9MICO|nr:ImmA/IrrE family metallo-endopeptidase [Candidatus Phosphoribacter hodrii]
MNTEVQARRRAESFRREHDLGHAPLGDLVELLIDTCGVDVVVMDADGAEHALTMRDPMYDRTVIAVATQEHSVRQRTSIAHELAHVLWHDEDLGPETSFGGRTPIESRADSFARHLLLPGGGEARCRRCAHPRRRRSRVGRAVRRFAPGGRHPAQRGRAAYGRRLHALGRGQHPYRCRTKRLAGPLRAAVCRGAPTPLAAPLGRSSHECLSGRPAGDPRAGLVSLSAKKTASSSSRSPSRLSSRFLTRSALRSAEWGRPAGSVAPAQLTGWRCC